jgi:hypothetical protein
MTSHKGSSLTVNEKTAFSKVPKDPQQGVVFTFIASKAPRPKYKANITGPNTLPLNLIQFSSPEEKTI